jgi:hypothetical protein
MLVAECVMQLAKSVVRSLQRRAKRSRQLKNLAHTICS